MSRKKKLFLVLWSAGMIGVLSFLFVDLSALIAHFPLPKGVEKPEVTPLLKLLSLLQPTIIMSAAILIGVAFASKVGLFSPVAEAAIDKRGLVSALSPQVLPGLIGGLAGGAAIVLIAALWKPFLPSDILARIAELGKLLPIPTRILYGGIVEELLLRWGLMTLLVWIPWRVFQRGVDKPKPVYYVGAILVSSIVFGLGHLPIAFMFFPQMSFALTSYVIVANSTFGIIAGYLYWKKGLESAMIAHMLTHVVMITATSLGAYFS